MELDLYRTDLHTFSSAGDPLGFVVMEQMILALTQERTPDFRPKDILRGGYQDYRRGREVRNQVKQLLDKQWLDLVNRLLSARNDLVEWQVRARQRELEFAELLRNEWKRFETIEKPRARFYHELEMEKLREINRGADPAWTVSRTLDSFDAINARLQQIAQSEATAAEKHQQAQLLIDSIRSSLNPSP